MKTFYYEETDSTNIRARELAREGQPHGTLIVADAQTEGRGRQGRTWQSPAGGSIYMSVILRPEIPASKACMLTLVAALSTAEAIKECTGIDAGIKWPNDLVINGKKVVGILTEMSAGTDKIDYVVIGVGINVNVEGFSVELKKTATSLKIETGLSFDRKTLIRAVMKRLEHNYKIFTETLNLKNLQEKYNSLLINKDRQVKILCGPRSYEAYALGINQKGELLVRKEDNTVEAIYAGEVSVRGLYGYV